MAKKAPEPVAPVVDAPAEVEDIVEGAGLEAAEPVEEEPVEPVEDAEGDESEAAEEESDAAGEAVEEEEAVEEDEDDSHAQQLLESLREPEVKKKPKAPPPAPEPVVDEYDGEFDVKKTPYFQTYNEMQEMTKELAEIEAEIKKADEAGDDDLRMELRGYKGALQAQLRRTDAKLQQDFADFEKRRDEFAGQKAIRLQEKGIANAMKRTEETVPSMKKHPAVRNTVEMIFRRGHQARFAGMSGAALEKAVILYGMREGMIPKGGAAAKPSRTTGTAAVKASPTIAGNKAAPAKSAGGKTVAEGRYAGEVIPHGYTEEDYRIARGIFSEEELKGKYKGRNMVQ